MLVSTRMYHCLVSNRMVVSAHFASLCRMLGQVGFRTKMLACHGTVVTVLTSRAAVVEGVSDDIEAAVKAKTGLPLDSFCR